MPFLLALFFFSAPSFADLPKDLPKETDAKTDARNDSCARIAVAAKSGRTIAPDDAALAACSAGNHTVCVRTRQLLDENPLTKDLITACTGPVQVASSLTEKGIAVCKLAMFVLGCATNGLPITPTAEDMSLPGITRPAKLPDSPGIISK